MKEIKREEFNYRDYLKSGHHDSYYSYASLLNFNDTESNPYGFSKNPIDDIEISLKIARMVALKYCQKYAIEREF